MTSLTSAPWPTIDAGFPAGTVLGGPTGGLLLWLLYGILGSLRVLRAPGGASLTFHLPFVGAAMVLGGPTAGAWVAFLSTLERRELETQPWYGILANHAILVIGAVAGGIAVQAIGLVLPGNAGGPSTLAAATAGALVLATVSTALGAFTILLREGLTRRELTEIVVGRIGRITAMECALVVVLALAYVQLGWWAPLLVAGFVLLIWDNHPMPPPDKPTGLPGKEGLRRGSSRPASAGCGAASRPAPRSCSSTSTTSSGSTTPTSTRSATRSSPRSALRLRAHARRADDLAGRLGGDEFAMYLPGLADPEVGVATGRRDRRRPVPVHRHHQGRDDDRRIHRRRGRGRRGGVPSGGGAAGAGGRGDAPRQGGGRRSHLYDPGEAPVDASGPAGPRLEDQRQISASPCSPTSGRPSANRPRIERRDVDGRRRPVEDQLRHPEPDGRGRLEPGAAVPAVEVEAVRAGGAEDRPLVG